MTTATTTTTGATDTRPGTLTGPSCNIPRCACTHTEPCDRGWINIEDDHGGVTAVRPCPTCRPELARIIATSWTAEERQHRLALRSRSIAAEG